MIGIIKVYGGMLLAGLGQTLLLTLLALIIAMVIGMIFGLMNVGHNRVLNLIGTVYVDAVRGVPLIVLAYFVYFGIPAAMQQMGMTNFRLSSLQAGIIALSMNCGAYMAEIIRGGIEAIDKGQMEAARSLGLPYGKAMSKIILPQAFRTMMPSIINQFIISMKDTSLISIIGIRELTQNGKIIAANSASLVMAIWVAVALYYLVICTILSRIAVIVERKVSYGKQ